MQSLFARIGLGLGLTLVIYLTTRGTVEYPLERGALYAVATDANRAEFDLPFAEAGAQYLVIVSNQAEDTAARRLEIEARPCDNPSPVALRRVAELSAEPIEAAIPPVEPRKKSPAPESRSFWLRTVGGSSSALAVKTRLAGQGEHVRVWVDEKDRVDQQRVEKIIACFEGSVRPLASKYLGLPADVDSDGCFGIVVTSWLGRLAGGRLPLGGMVNTEDFDAGADNERANRADVLYLNAELEAGPHLETVLAHEFAHAVTASGRLRQGNLLFAASREEAWLNEAIAHVTENLQSDNWSNLDHRVAQFLARPEATPLVVPDYQAAGLWRAPGPRGSTYLFLRWCVEQYGPGLLPALIYSGRSGVANLEAATGQPFVELHRRFAADLFLRAIDEQSSSKLAAGLLPDVNLDGRLGNRDLAGPRFERWELPAAHASLDGVSVVGTGVKYLVVSAARPGPRRLRVRAENGASLQVTLVRLPDTLPQLELTAAPDADGAWRLALNALDGSPVRVERVGCETLVPEQVRQDAGSQPIQIATGIEACFASGVQSTAGQLTSGPLDLANLPRGPVAVHVIGYDAQGRRAAAWTTIDLGASPVHVATAVKETRRR